MAVGTTPSPKQPEIWEDMGRISLAQRLPEEDPDHSWDAWLGGACPATPFPELGPGPVCKVPEEQEAPTPGTSSKSQNPEERGHGARQSQGTAMPSSSGKKHPFCSHLALSLDDSPATSPLSPQKFIFFDPKAIIQHSQHHGDFHGHSCHVMGDKNIQLRKATVTTDTKALV